jgi:hypothetical protein
MGLTTSLLDENAVRRAVNSERFVAGLLDPHHSILNPAKLARGMKRVIESRGVEVFERSKVLRIEPGRGPQGSRQHSTRHGFSVRRERPAGSIGYEARADCFRQRVRSGSESAGASTLVPDSRRYARVRP